MAIRISQSGINARNDTVADLNKAISELQAAKDELRRCKGMGAELYIKKIDDYISRYTDLKNKIARIH